MKKIISLLLVLALSATMLIGCGEETQETGSSESTDKQVEDTKNESASTEDEEKVAEKEEEPMDSIVSGPTEITFVYAGGDPLVKEQISTIVQRFNESMEDITIIEEPSGSGAYLDFIKTKDAIGEFPDMLDSRDTQVWVEADKLAEIPDSVLELLANPPVFNGKNYVAPISLQLPSLGMYYNKKMFEELNLSEPKTYAEFEALCETIKESGVSPIVQGGKDVWHMGFLWSQFWLEGVLADNPDWSADRTAGNVSFTDDNVIAVFDKYTSLYDKGYIDEGFLSTADNQLTSFLIAEKAAMFFSGSWMINQIKDADPSFELGWFPLPDEDGNLSLLYGPRLQGFALSKKASEDPDKVAAFEAFMKFWYAEENYVPYLTAIVQAPATVAEYDVPYESEFPIEFSEALKASKSNDIFWNQKWGENLLPGGIRNFAYKAFQEKVALGQSSQELGETLDKQWDVEVAQTE